MSDQNRSDRMRQEAIEYIRSERDWEHAFLIAAELAKLGEYGDGFAKARAQEWREVIDKLAKDGLIEERNGEVRAVRSPKVSKESKQMELF